MIVRKPANKMQKYEERVLKFVLIPTNVLKCLFESGYCCFEGVRLLDLSLFAINLSLFTINLALFAICVYY